MQKGSNYNHPVKGSTIKVDPIKDCNDIDRIKKLLYNKPLDYCLFIIGINTNLRACDILNIKTSQVESMNNEIVLIEKKTKKERRITLNKSCIDAIKRTPKNNEYLFTGQRGIWTVPTVNKKVKSWCRKIGLKGNYGSHTLRKTWGYHQRVTFEIDLPTLMICFNHSTQRQTLNYLCIQPEEIRDVYLNEL